LKDINNDLRTKLQEDIDFHKYISGGNIEEVINSIIERIKNDFPLLYDFYIRNMTKSVTKYQNNMPRYIRDDIIESMECAFLFSIVMFVMANEEESRL
jgi:hypothetical protein